MSSIFSDTPGAESQQEEAIPVTQEFHAELTELTVRFMNLMDKLDIHEEREDAVEMMRDVEAVLDVMTERASAIVANMDSSANAQELIREVLFGVSPK